MDDVDDHAVARFVEVTSATPEHATFFLQACGGNFDRAVQMYQQGLLFSAVFDAVFHFNHPLEFFYTIQDIC